MKNFAKLLTTALMIGCLAAGIAGCGGSEGGKDAAAVKQTVIYTNSDEEAALKVNILCSLSVLPNWAANLLLKVKTLKLTL